MEQLISDITYVTSYNIIYGTDTIDSEKGIKWRINHFINLASLGINICVYGDNITTPFIQEIILKYPNVKLLELDYKKTSIYKLCTQKQYNITNNRNIKKDTVEYMTLMNCKFEYVNDSIQKNPFNTNIFAWIDFSISYIFSSQKETLVHLKEMSYKSFNKKFIAFPGFWEKVSNNNKNILLCDVNWRFAGSFFAGDKFSLLNLYTTYIEHLELFFLSTNTIIWEVNFLAWIEADINYELGWYYTNTYDNIIKLPSFCFMPQLIVKKTNCDGIGNVLKCFINCLCITNNSLIECNENYIFGNYDTIIDSSQVLLSNNLQIDTNREYVYTCRLLVLIDEESEQENIFNEYQFTDGIQNNNLNNLFSFKKLIDFNYDSTKIIPKIKNRIINAIDKIKINQNILNDVNIFKTTNIDNYCQSTLGISVRTWKSIHESNIDRPYSFDIYKKEILNVINIKNIKNIIISIDNIDYINEYEILFNELQISYIILQENESYNKIQNALFKMLVLSKCNLLIANRISTFSELIFWFSKCNITVYPVF